MSKILPLTLPSHAPLILHSHSAHMLRSHTLAGEMYQRSSNKPGGAVQTLCAALAAVTDAVVDVSTCCQCAHVGCHADV